MHSSPGEVGYDKEKAQQLKDQIAAFVHPAAAHDKYLALARVRMQKLRRLVPRLETHLAAVRRRRALGDLSEREFASEAAPAWTALELAAYLETVWALARASTAEHATYVLGRVRAAANTLAHRASQPTVTAHEAFASDETLAAAQRSWGARVSRGMWEGVRAALMDLPALLDRDLPPEPKEAVANLTPKR